MDSVSATHRSFFNPTTPFLSASTSFCSQLQPWRSVAHRVIRCKQSQHDSRDFQFYAKPLRLLQASEVKVCTENAEETVFASLNKDESRSLYKVKFGTSRFSGSSLSNVTAGVLLCLIDENGDSILQRIPASSVSDRSVDPDDELLRFQRGSVDEFAFEGPNLGRVRAIWIGLESGQWRLDGVSLTVLSENKENKEKYIGVEYVFQADDVHLGDKSDISMLELRPFQTAELSEVDPSDFLRRKSLPVGSQNISNEESMREYADLKLSLLLYDALLIGIGTSAFSFSDKGHEAFAFLVGGSVGFLYLLLLQSSVDGLLSSEWSSARKRLLVSGLALATGFAFFTVKYGSGEFQVAFGPKDLVLGLTGFLCCKVAVVLAAVKPVVKGFKVNK